MKQEANNKCIDLYKFCVAVKHLENIHPNITYTSVGIAHSILNALPLALLASGIAIGVVYLIKKNRN